MRGRHQVRMSEGGIPLSHSLLSSSPSLHGGRGATVSEGGRPSDLSALAGGGRHSPLPPVLRAFCLPSRNGEDEQDVDHQESGDYGFYQPAARSSPWLWSRLPRQLLHSWLALNLSLLFLFILYNIQLWQCSLHAKIV